MHDSQPLVTIGVPVYNGATYLARSLEALLAQEYANTEIVISDNASTDSSFQIAQEYAKKDPRIRCFRNDLNVGSVANFNSLPGRAGGKYFMWAACHDLWRPSLVSRCVEVLERDPSVVLCIPGASFIDPQGRTLGPIPGGVDTRGLSRAARYKRVLDLVGGFAVYGLFRLDALRQAPPMRETMGPDSLLLVELSLLGAYALAPGELFFMRKLPEYHDWHTYYGKLKIKFGPWAALRLSADFVASYFDIVRRRALDECERVNLTIATAIFIFHRAGPQLLSMILAGFAPGVHRRLIELGLAVARRLGDRGES